jgi:putative ABC transport system ATP-binding protein
LTHQIELRDVTKKYGETIALTNVSLRIASGAFIAVIGKSGSGKSTLLNLIAGIDTPTSGEVIVQGTAVHQLNQDEVAIWRGKNIGVVFQFFQLLPTLTVLENVMLPMDFCNVIPSNDRRSRAYGLLEQFGIADQAQKLPATLSGGQQQRAAMARALANDPPILVADEPTGNLDSHTADLVLQLFQDLSVQGKTVVMVTHERDITAFARGSITLSDGEIVQRMMQNGVSA